jgi:hypothetical protein
LKVKGLGEAGGNYCLLKYGFRLDKTIDPIQFGSCKKYFLPRG